MGALVVWRVSMRVLWWQFNLICQRKIKKQIEKLKEVDFIKYVKEKEILFIKTDLKKIRNDKTDYSRLIKYYKRKLVDYGVMKEIRKAKKQNVKYFGKRIKEQKIA